MLHILQSLVLSFTMILETLSVFFKQLSIGLGFILFFKLSTKERLSDMLFIILFFIGEYNLDCVGVIFFVIV